MPRNSNPRCINVVLPIYNLTMPNDRAFVSASSDACTRHQAARDHPRSTTRPTSTRIESNRATSFIEAWIPIDFRSISLPSTRNAASVRRKERKSVARKCNDGSYRGRNAIRERNDPNRPSFPKASKKHSTTRRSRKRFPGNSEGVSKTREQPA